MSSYSPSSTSTQQTAQLLQNQRQFSGTNLNVRAVAPTQEHTLETQELVQPVTFAQQAVKNLRESDFTLDSKLLIALKYSDCVLCLFYAHNLESRESAEIWAQAAAQTSSPVFAACNLILEKRVAEAFTAVGADKAHPFYWARMMQIPFIIVYSGGWPKAFYNGRRIVQSIVGYSLTLACQADYVEREQNFASMQVASNVQVNTPTKFITPFTTSQQFQGDDIRGYNSGITYASSNSNVSMRPQSPGTGVLLGNGQSYNPSMPVSATNMPPTGWIASQPGSPRIGVEGNVVTRPATPTSPRQAVSGVGTPGIAISGVSRQPPVDDMRAIATPQQHVAYSSLTPQQQITVYPTLTPQQQATVYSTLTPQQQAAVSQLATRQSPQQVVALQPVSPQHVSRMQRAANAASATYTAGTAAYASLTPEQRQQLQKLKQQAIDTGLKAAVA
jgi:hypothetical protein